MKITSTPVCEAATATLAANLGEISISPTLARSRHPNPWAGGKNLLDVLLAAAAEMMRDAGSKMERHEVKKKKSFSLP